MSRFNQDIIITKDIILKLEYKDNENEVWVYGNICYKDGDVIPFEHAVAKTNLNRSFYYWDESNIYIVNELGKIKDISFNIDKKDFEFIKNRNDVSLWYRSNRSLTFTHDIKLSNNVILLLDRYLRGSDYCESIKVYYSKDEIISLAPVIICTPSDYEVTTYYLWDDNNVYTCYDGENNEIMISSIFDINKKKVTYNKESKEEKNMLELVNRVKYDRMIKA